jgi:hypothetical protein
MKKKYRNTFYFLKIFFRALWSDPVFYPFFSKSILGFQKWTKINVQNSKPKILFEKIMQKWQKFRK